MARKPTQDMKQLRISCRGFHITWLHRLEVLNSFPAEHFQEPQ